MKTLTIGMIVLLAALPMAALAGGKHAGGHEGHGMAGHHGPGAWNAPEEAAAQPNPVPADADSIARGEALFAQNCVVCHGANGEGDGPLAASLKPPPADLRVMAPMHPPGDLAWKIAEGRGAMPSWRQTLSEQQIWDLVNYLKHGLEAAEGEDAEHEHHRGEHHH